MSDDVRDRLRFAVACQDYLEGRIDRWEGLLLDLPVDELDREWQELKIADEWAEDPLQVSDEAAGRPW
ncbi:MAG: hypothetical protein BGO49_10360 [Planctomycetales bacterium 71-10]|nr:MAG: hypothetical protein BGO49_10360 [Planctomycetales bacterium 71-10]